MMTERKRPSARLNLSSREWKLYLVAALGAAYSVAWSVASKPTPATASSGVDASQPVVVWASDPTLVSLDSALPSGWSMAAAPVGSVSANSSAPAGPSIVSAPPLPSLPQAAGPRIRTRSS